MAQTLIDLLNHRSFDPKAIASQKDRQRQELDSATKQAFQEGYDQGVLDTKISIDQQILTLVGDLPIKVEGFLKETQTTKEDVMQLALKLAFAMFQKFLPTLTQDMYEKEIEKFTQTVLDQIPQQTLIAIKCNPQVMQGLKDKLSGETIKLVQDEALGPLDVQITWENGHIEKNSTIFLKNLENLIETIDFQELSRLNGSEEESQ